MVLSQVLLVALAFAGVRKNVAGPLSVAILLAGMIPMFFWIVQAAKQQKAADQRGEETADAEWQRGEADLAASETR